MKICGKGALGRGNRECKDLERGEVWGVQEPKRRGGRGQMGVSCQTRDRGRTQTYSEGSPWGEGL